MGFMNLPTVSLLQSKFLFFPKHSLIRYTRSPKTIMKEYAYGVIASTIQEEGVLTITK